jgi:type VI secretion system protein ImpF
MTVSAGSTLGKLWLVVNNGMQASILDRLTENGELDGNRSRSRQLTSQLKEFLLRDLSALLNTRRAEQDFDKSFEQSTNSLLTFGVTDFTSYNLNNGIDQERARQSLERAIRQFEPRLTGVSVSLEQPEPLHPVLILRVEAVMHAEYGSEPVTFEAALHRASRRIAFEGTRV